MAAKERRARNVREGMEVLLADGEWARVESAVHITAPVKAVSFKLDGGRNAGAYPDDPVVSRPGGAS